MKWKMFTFSHRCVLFVYATVSTVRIGVNFINSKCEEKNSLPPPPQKKMQESVIYLERKVYGLITKLLQSVVVW